MAAHAYAQQYAPASLNELHREFAGRELRDAVIEAASAARRWAFATASSIRADHVEGRFRQVVVFAVHEAPAAHRILHVDELAWRAGECFRDVEGLRQEALDLAGASDVSLSSSSPSMPRMAMMSCSDLYFCSVSWT